MGKQHLRTAQSIFAQLGFIHLRQAHLPHCCCCLQLTDIVWTRRPAQALHAFSNRAAGHHDDFPAIAHQNSQLTAPFTNSLGVQSTTFIGHQAGAHLDHDPPCITHYICHFFMSFLAPSLRHYCVRSYIFYSQPIMSVRLAENEDLYLGESARPPVAHECACKQPSPRLRSLRD